MMQEKYFKDRLEEKIYTSNSNDSKEKTTLEINDFLMSLAKRKRNDLYEGGLQASLICFNGCFAAKISENDGREPHMANEYNLFNFLNHKDKYLTDEGREHFILYQMDYLFIEKFGFTIRILDGEDSLLFAIVSKNNIESEFQVYVLTTLINLCKQMKDNNIYKNIEIGIHAKNIEVEFDEYENNFDEFLDKLSKIKESKTRI